MTNPIPYRDKKWVYLLILVSFQAVFLDNICKGQFHWAKNYKLEAQRLIAIFGRDKALTTNIQKVNEVRVYVVVVFFNLKHLKVNLAKCKSFF